MYQTIKEKIHMIEFESMNNLLQKKKIAEIEIEYLNNEKEKIEAIYSDEGNNAPTNESKAPFNSEHDKKIVELTHRLAFDNKYNQMNLIERLDYVKKELEELPDYQSMTTDPVGLYDDGYRYKVKLKGQQWELWVDVYPTEDEYAEKTEANKYMIRVDQFLMYP